MIDEPRRREIAAEYQRTPAQAGVYRIRCAGTDRLLLGSSLDLRAERNKLAWAQATGSPGALDGRLSATIAEIGLDAMTFEVLEVLDVTPRATTAQMRSDLATLEELWAEKLAAGSTT